MDLGGQQRFIQEYLIDPNATKAAIRAGYSAKTARFVGCKNITKANIAEAIEKAQTKRAERCEVTGDMVVDELRKIGFANMADYVSVDGDLDFAALTRDQTAALSEVSIGPVSTDTLGSARNPLVADTTPHAHQVPWLRAPIMLVTGGWGARL